MGESVSKSDSVDDCVDPFAIAVSPTERERKVDVLLCRECRNEVERLEDETNFGSSEFGEFLVLQICETCLTDECIARGEAVEPCNAVHKGGFSRTAGPHDGGELGACKFDIDVVQGSDGSISTAICLGAVHDAGSSSQGTGSIHVVKSAVDMSVMPLESKFGTLLDR